MYKIQGESFDTKKIINLCVTYKPLGVTKEHISIEDESSLFRISDLLIIEHDMISVLTDEDKEMFGEMWDTISTHDGIISFTFFPESMDELKTQTCYELLIKFRDIILLNQWDIERELIKEFPSYKEFKSYIRPTLGCFMLFLLIITVPLYIC